MINWWLRLAPRDQRTLLIGGLLLAVLLPYWLAWLPLVERGERLTEMVTQQREDLAWMETAAQQLRELRGSAAAPLASGGGSLLGRVDVAVREAGLSGTVRRVQPEGDDRVQVWLEGIGFDAMLGWLTVLQRDHGVRVDSLAVDRRAEPGMVDGRVLLLLEAK
jgi:general secretion pathway protein M